MARTKLAVALVLAGALAAPSANALGLGAIEVKSALNQPLDARIPLLPADEAELETLSVSLASTVAFQRAGIDRPFGLTRLRFTIVQEDKPYVHVTTEQPVKEPFLDFLVQAEWDRGRLVREFTLLLDPPVYAGSGVAPVVAPVPLSSSERTVSAAAAVGQPAAPAYAAGERAVPSSAAGRDYGPVGANETLWSIANEVQPDASVSVNQVMVALLRANPEAFIDGDINRLRRGSVLQVPELNEIAAIDSTAANQEVRAQMQRWHQARATAQQRGRLQVVAPAEPDTAADEARPEQAAADQATLASLQQELKGYRESSISLQAENEDLKAQVEGLKQELAHFERLLSLSVQQPIAGAEGEAEDAAAVDQTAQESATQDVEPTASEAQSAAAEQEAAQPTAATQPTPAVQEIKEPSFFDDTRNLTTLGGVAAALLGLLYLLIRRRRSAAEADAVEAMALAAEAVEAEDELSSSAEELAPEPVAAAADEEAEEEQDDEHASAVADLMDEPPPEGDALSEAEVYLAYGRYDQARDLLEEGLEREPSDTALRLKLLETLALMQDEDSFITHARLLQEQVDASDESWLRAQEMGQEFLPDEPMFSGEQLESGEAQPEDSAFDLDFDNAAFQSPVAEDPQPVAADAQETEPGDDFSIDFELPGQEVAPAEAEQEQAAAAFEGIEGLEPVDPPLQTDAGELDLADLSFGEPVAEETEDNVLDFSSPSEQGSDEQAESVVDLDELDEVGIKLNLARAYLDMGDNEGARNLIDEVLAEGSSRQREEAESLLQQLA